MDTDTGERWRGAECAGLDPQTVDKIFFDQKGRPPNNRPYKVYCVPCPIRAFCLSYGLVHDEEGVWGGLTKSQRDSLPSSVKQELTAHAVRQGWYEQRLSIDELLRLGRRAVETQEEPDLAEVIPLPQKSQEYSEFQFDFEVRQVSGSLAMQNSQGRSVLVQEFVTRSLTISSSQPVELQAEPLPPTVVQESYSGPKEFLFDFELP